MKKISFRQFKIIVSIVSLSIILSGCSGESKWFRDRSNDYKNVESCPRIQIPCDVHAEDFSSEYQIP